jgi:hypothetical protein
MSETADFSSDNERNPWYPSESSRSRATSSVYSISASSPDVIVILDSDDDEEDEKLVNCIVKLEKKPKLEDLPRAIKREDLLFKFFLRLNGLWSK